jgi:hypothetical protein
MSMHKLTDRCLERIRLVIFVADAGGFAVIDIVLAIVVVDAVALDRQTLIGTDMYDARPRRSYGLA